MAVIIPVGYAQITYNFDGALLPDGGGASVFGYKLAIGETLEDAAQVAADAWTDEIKPSTSSAVTLTSVTAVTDTEIAELAVGQAGANSLDVLPPNVSVLFHKITTRRGRRGRGRWFPPGLLYEFAVDTGGMIEAASVTALQGVADDFLAAFGSMVILQGDEGASAPIVPPPGVTALVLDPMVSTQRKRLR